MRRRDFLKVLAGSAGWPAAARAQQGAMPTIGFLNSATPVGYARMVAAFRDGLKDTGYVERETVAIEYRWAHDDNARLPALAADLVHRAVAVIAANGPAAAVAKRATPTIPIVFFGGIDPIRTGLVTSLSRPGGNATGATILNVELIPKRLEIVRELLPAAKSAGLLVNPTNPNVAQVSAGADAAGRNLGQQIHVLHASNDRDIDAAFTEAAKRKVDALAIGPDPFFNTRTLQFAALTLRHKLPTIYQYREFVAAGGLLSYGGSITDLYRLVGRYTGRILKGEKPADLPVQQASKVELFINLKTAQALGISVPLSLLGRADEVIE